MKYQLIMTQAIMKELQEVELENILWEGTGND